MSVQQRRINSMERRPRMLKDFLSENSNSCSSGGFKSLPRKPNDPPGTSSSSMPRNSNSVSAFQTLINAVKTMSFFGAVKKSSTMILPRSLSRKLSWSRSRRINSSREENETKITVKIKDVIRWKSFRDLTAEEQQPPPPPPPPLDFGRWTTAAATATGSTTTTTTCSSSNSSWSDSDFTSGYSSSSSSWDAQNDVEAGKRFSPLVVGKHSVESTTRTAVGAKEVLICQEEQQSPVSVLQVGEYDFSPDDQSLANIERRKQKFMQTVRRLKSLAKFDLANLDQCFSLDENSGSDEKYDDDDDDNELEEQDWVEKRAKQLLHCVKATCSVQSCNTNLDKLLLDFFREELSGRKYQTRNDDEFEWEILRIAEDWINGSFDYDTEHDNKDACIKDMDGRGRWSRLEEEQEELAMEIEAAILHNLVADLLDLDD